MYTLWVKNLKNRYLWFVLDETMLSIENMVDEVVKRYEKKKIVYAIREATAHDINQYGGLSELYIAEYIIECSCLLDLNDDDKPER